MDYESEYTDDDYGSDRDTVEEPRHSFTQEARNLFSVSLVTDLVVDRHTEACLERSQEGERGHCRCAPARYFFLGQRAIPQEGVERFSVSPMFDSLALLELCCEQNIHTLRLQAKIVTRR
jgi:hypothetical protein